MRHRTIHRRYRSRARTQAPVQARLGFTWALLALGLTLPAAVLGADSPSGAASATAKAGVAASTGASTKARALLRVDADSLRVTLELPKSALAAIGVLRAP